MRQRTFLLTRPCPFLGQLAALLCTTVLLLASQTQGQSTRRSVAAYEGLRPAPDNFGFLHARGTPTPGHLRPQFTLASGLSTGELTLKQPDTGSATRAVRVRSRADLVAQLGLGSRGALLLDLPLILYQQGQRETDRPALPVTALVDPVIQGRYRLLGRIPNTVGERADGPGLALEATAHLPFGDDNAYASEGALRAELSAIVDFQLLGAAIAAHMGILHRFKTPELAGLGPNDALTYGLAARLPSGFWTALSVLAEVNGATGFAGTATSPLQILLGARVHHEEWSLQMMGGFGALGSVASPDGLLSLAIRYAPAVQDTDGDGTPDDKDQCPFLPEDLDGFQDEDGCDDPDNDNDLIPDEDDLCPNEEALEGMDEDEDGCTDTQDVTP